MNRDRSPQDERGIALVLTLIFSILLYILVAELVVSGRMLRHTGENDARLARMQNQMEYTLSEVCDSLLSDMAGQAAGGDGSSPGGVPGLGNAPGGSAPGSSGDGSGDSQPDPSSSCDSSRDSWAQPQSRAEGDLTTYYMVEPENAKFNLLAIWSPDKQFADAARDQLVRLIDSLREDSDYDINAGDAEQIVKQIDDWAHRPGTDSIPKPLHKSDDDKVPDLSLPSHLDELLMVPSITEDLFFDKVIDGKIYRGLESVITVWTSLQMDPGDPDKNARNAAAAASSGQTPPASGNQPAGNSNSKSGGANAGGSNPPDPNAPPPQPVGEGIRININFASRPVLRSLMPAGRMPDSVIDAIIKWRNEEDPDEKAKADQAQSQSPTQASDFGDLRLGDDVKKRFFSTVSDLEKVKEFSDLPDPELKAEFEKFCTTKSDVFSIHLATIYKRNEETRSYVMRRARSVVVRRDNGDSGTLYPIIRLEERHGLRLSVPDIQDDHPDLLGTYSQMDSFAQEDRAWNPFLLEFYLPKAQRDQFYIRNR